MAHTVNIFLLLFGALQGLILGFFLLRRKKRDPSQVFLVLFLLVAGLQLTFKVVTKAWLMENVFLYYRLSYCLPWLTGPLLYLFFYFRENRRPIRAADFLHFIPFLLLFTLTIITVTVQPPRAIYVIFRFGIQASLELISLYIYAFLSWRVIRAGADKLKSGLNRFLYFAVAAETVIIITLALMQAYYGRFPDVRWLFISLTFLIYWMTYKLLDQPELFMPRTDEVVPMQVESNQKYAHSGLKAEEAQRIASQLRMALDEKKIFLQSNLTIESLAAAVGSTRHHLSQVINGQFQKSYFDLVNGYRLEEARRRLSDPKFAHYTIAAVALDSGFSSVSGFNELFRKTYQQTPSQFRSRQVKIMTA